MLNNTLRSLGLSAAAVALAVLVGCATTEEPKPAPAPVPAPATPAPAPAPAPAPTPKPEAPKPPPAPVAQKVTLAADVLFDFDKSVIKPDGKSRLDDLAQKVRAISLEVVIAIGHADSIGTDAYNQKLSERRADAVRDYLVSKGVDKAKIETIGMGEKQPVVQCDQKNPKELIACLQPNRRVEVEVKGEGRK
jgi:OOP family OmpA-OmpF porin